MPYQQTPTGRGQMTMHVRITGNTSAVADRIREEVLATDKDMPAFEVQTVAAEVDASIIQDGLIARLAGFFGILALLLVSIGLYGLVANILRKGPVRSVSAWRSVRSPRM